MYWGSVVQEAFGVSADVAMVFYVISFNMLGGL